MGGKSCLLLFETQPHSIAQASLHPVAILSYPPKDWNYRCKPQYATLKRFFKVSFSEVGPQNNTAQGNGLPGKYSALQSTTEWMGDSLQTSLRKDSSQASSKILSVYCIQLSSIKSQTCTSVTVERQKAIHTPTMAPAANTATRMERRAGWKGGSETQTLAKEDLGQ